MHAIGKSDKLIRARKRMNKGNQLSGDSQKLAESVERRGLAEGNTRRAPTAETQCSGKVSRGLEGVREAVHRDKRLRFTALLHHVSGSTALMAAIENGHTEIIDVLN